MQSTVSNSLADGLYSSLAENQGTLSNFLNFFKIWRDIRCDTMEGFPNHYVRNDLITVSEISKHGFVQIIYRRDLATVIKKKTGVIQLTNILPKPSWKVLEMSHQLNCYKWFLLGPMLMDAVKFIYSPTFSWKNTERDRVHYFVSLP